MSNRKKPKMRSASRFTRRDMVEEIIMVVGISIRMVGEAKVVARAIENGQTGTVQFVMPTTRRRIYKMQEQFPVTTPPSVVTTAATRTTTPKGVTVAEKEEVKVAERKLPLAEEKVVEKEKEVERRREKEKARVAAPASGD